MCGETLSLAWVEAPIIRVGTAACSTRSGQSLGCRNERSSPADGQIASHPMASRNSCSARAKSGSSNAIGPVRLTSILKGSNSAQFSMALPYLEG
jgi:hypothetical protein